MERDRAAAFFADREDGSQVMICSEIGSEGRNFQFAHHLVLFDLPLNPDLLEQRIGRLDRIGQTETIKIHVPYLKDSAQEIMYRWYHDGLSAFEHTCPAGHNVFVMVESALIEALHQIEEGIEDLSALISTTAKLHREVNETLHRGRDRLLEYNSCRPSSAAKIRDFAIKQDNENESVLPAYLDAIFDCFGVDSEEGTETSTIIRPGDHMRVSSFPGLKEDGMTITYKRDTALANEDMHFLTWEHDMVLSSELGNTAVTAAKITGVAAGTILLECLYVLETPSNQGMQTDRYLPSSTIRIVVDESGANRGEELPHEVINRSRVTLDGEIANRIIRSRRQQIKKLVAVGEKLANAQTPEILAEAYEQTKQSLTTEINRLKALALVNPNVREEEIRHYEFQWGALKKSLGEAGLRLDALRVILAT